MSRRQGKRKRRDWGKGWVEVRQRVSGDRYVARWMEDGKQHSKSFTDENDALDHLDARERERRRNVPQRGQVPTVEQVGRAWLRAGQYHWEDSSTYTYERIFDNHIAPAFGPRRLDSLTATEMQAWVDSLDRKYKASTAGNIGRVLQMVCAHAERVGLVPVSPFRGVRLPRAERRVVKVWDQASMREMLATTTANAEDRWWYAFYAVVMCTGMRRGELLALRWEDVDLDAGTIHVWQTVAPGRDGRPVIVTRTKGKRNRRIAIPEVAVAALRRIAQPGGLVFGRADGSPYVASTLRYQHRQWAGRVGLDHIRIHDLRHSFATLMLEENVNLKVVSEVLGHSSTATTLETYQHVTDALTRQAAGVVGHVLSPPMNPNGEEESPE